MQSYSICTTGIIAGLKKSWEPRLSSYCQCNKGNGSSAAALQLESFSIHNKENPIEQQNTTDQWSAHRTAPAYLGQGAPWEIIERSRGCTGCCNSLVSG